MEAGKKAAGFVTDFDTLIHRLRCKGDEGYRFTEFCSLWQEMEFYKLFYGRKSDCDQADFADACNQITLKFLNLDQPDMTFVKVTCVYMLYGLWTCQPALCKRRIRCTFQDFQKVKTFVTTMKGDGHNDIAAVFARLIHSRAFDFCLTRTPHLLGTSDVWDPPITSDECSPALDNVVPAVPEDFEDSLVCSIMNLRVAWDSMLSVVQRVRQYVPDDTEPINFTVNANPADRLDHERHLSQQRAVRTRVTDPEACHYEGIYQRRQRLRQLAKEHTSDYEPVTIEAVDAVEDIKEDFVKPVIRKHQTSETFNQRHLVEMQSLFPRGNKSQYPTKDLVQIANSTKIKRGRPFTVDVENRVIQKGKRGYWHCRTDRHNGEDIGEDDRVDSGVSSNASDEGDEQIASTTVRGSIQRIIETTKEGYAMELEKIRKHEELEQERLALVDAKFNGADKQYTKLKERELKQREKLLKLEEEGEMPKKHIGRPRKKKSENAQYTPEEKKLKLQMEIEDIKARQKNQYMGTTKILEANDIYDQPLENKKFKKVSHVRTPKKTSKRVQNSPKKSPKKEKKVKEPAPIEPVEISKLKIGDILEIENDDGVEPQLVKVAFICETGEEFRGHYWEMRAGQVGMALYERTWIPKLSDQDEYVFCKDDIVQKVQMRNLKTGTRLTAKSASEMAPRYGLDV